MTSTLLLMLSTLFGCTLGTLYQDCGSHADIQEFVLTKCEIPPCIVERPSNYDVNITFVPDRRATDLDTIIGANIGGVDFPWPGPDGCPLLEGDSCPLVAGRTYKYHASMPVLVEYPTVSAIVTWKITDENGIDHACLVFPITLV